MIGKITIGKSFKGCVLYCMNDKKQELGKELVMKDRAELLHYNLCYGDKHDIIRQLNEVRQLNPKLSKPVMHITLSLAPGDSLGKAGMSELAERCAKKMGFEKNQYVAIMHKDKDHEHLHIIVNRVGFDGRTVSDSNNYQKIAEFCREMELKYELKKVLSPKKFLSKEQRQMERKDSRKEKLKEDIRQTLHRSRSYGEFEERMQRLGYDVIKGRGIAFRDAQKVYSKGSDIGYPLAAIERKLQIQLPREKAISRDFPVSRQQKSQAENSEVRKDFFRETKNKQHEEEMIETIMKPVRDDEGVPYELRKVRKHRISH